MNGSLDKHIDSTRRASRSIFLSDSESQRQALAVFIPALSREKGILAKGSQELWPHSQGQPHQGMGGGMHQAILAEEDILKSSIQLPLLQCHAQQVDF